MPYTPLDVADIAAGKPTKEEIFQTIHDNSEYFNTSIDALQQTAIVDVFNIKFGGNIDQYSENQISERIPVYRAPLDGTLLSFVITLLSPSTSGTLEIDIEKSTDDGVNWVSLLDNPVALSGTTTGSLSGTVDWTSPSAQDFEQTDLLRITVVNTQVDQGEFQVAIYAEAT